MPMPHPNVYGPRGSECSAQRPGLGVGSLPNGRATADLRIAGPDFRNELGWGGPPAAHVEQVGLDLVEAAGSAVRHQEHGDTLSRHVPIPPRADASHPTTTGGH